MANHKFKRYNGENGSMVDQTEEEAANEAALNADLPRRRMADAAMAEGAKGEKAYSGPKAMPEEQSTAKPSSFKNAFAAARRAGDKIFEYNGKKFTTDMAGAAPKAASTATKTSAEEPAGNIKLNSLRDTKKRNFDPALRSSESVGNSQMDTLRKQMEQDRNIKLNSLRATKNQDPNAAARARLSRGEGDEAGTAMKRGGAVKKMASGGSVGSASRRADGIAQRGKTKGRMC